ncbi:MAG: hypothetical protein IPL71_02950 [Anaerolineales bacterium]|uniref:hypothetical protein n=1 Tax=Candidatus Villigracilis proximus TaxID=3140683 RepID=UPI003134BA6D|nr:hypothetical protein [Anaerolineales bacterium]
MCGFNTRRATPCTNTTRHGSHGLVHADLLNALSMLGEASMQDMSIMMAMDRTTLTRNLSPLLKKGLVKYVADRPPPIKITKISRRSPPYWQKPAILDSFHNTTAAAQPDKKIRSK